MTTGPHLGDVSTYVAEVRHVLEGSYAVEERDFGDRRVLVGHRRDFKLKWLASRLNTTVTIVGFDATVDVATLDAYLEAAGRSARASASGVRGMQSGSAAVAIAVLPTVSQIAHDWAARPHGHKFASIGYPVVVGLDPPIVVEPERMRVGKMFAGFLREIVDDVARAPLSTLNASR